MGHGRDASPKREESSLMVEPISTMLVEQISTILENSISQLDLNSILYSLLIHALALLLFFLQWMHSVH